MKHILLVFLFLLPSCFSSDQKDDMSELTQEERLQYYPLVDLTHRTRLLRRLIETGDLNDIFENLHPDEAEQLRDNWSPARVAFGMEVEDDECPFVVVCFYREQSQHKPFLAQLQELAKQKEDIKFVLVDGDKLFALVEWAAIETFPTLLFVKDGEIVDHLEDATIQHVKQKLSELYE